MFSVTNEKHVYRKLNNIISDTDYDQVSPELTLFREQMFHKTKLIKLDGARHNKKLDLSRVSHGVTSSGSHSSHFPRL